MTSTAAHVLAPNPPHYVWDNAIVPKLSVRSGDSVTFDTRDASDLAFNLESTTADLTAWVFRGHPLTGPVFVEGASPGDTLQVDVLEVKPAAVGWTAIVPGLGLLSEDFLSPHLHMWDLSGGTHALLGDRIRIPLEPFCGVMGVAMAAPGEHPTLPPSRVGGNIDVRQLVAGASLYLPVEVEGALFSVGDAHAAQGDGEVCVTAIEMSSVTTLRFTVRKDLRVEETQFSTPGLRTRGSSGACYVTTANGPDLFENAKNAVRYMIAYLSRSYALSREDAYLLCSVAVDLKISQIVDAPNWIVSAFLPNEIFV